MKRNVEAMQMKADNTDAEARATNLQTDDTDAEARAMNVQMETDDTDAKTDAEKRDFQTRWMRGHLARLAALKSQMEQIAGEQTKRRKLTKEQVAGEPEAVHLATRRARDLASGIEEHMALVDKLTMNQSGKLVKLLTKKQVNGLLLELQGLETAANQEARDYFHRQVTKEQIAGESALQTATEPMTATEQASQTATEPALQTATEPITAGSSSNDRMEEPFEESQVPPPLADLETWLNNFPKDPNHEMCPEDVALLSQLRSLQNARAAAAAVAVAQPIETFSQEMTKSTAQPIRQPRLRRPWRHPLAESVAQPTAQPIETFSLEMMKSVAQPTAQPTAQPIVQPIETFLQQMTKSTAQPIETFSQQEMTKSVAQPTA